MKKILFTVLCTAIMLSCGGNKAKHEGCNGNHGECTEQHEGCSGNHEGCEGNHEGCSGNHEGCSGNHEGCEGNHEGCEGNHEGCEGNHEGCEGNHEGCSGNHEGCEGKKSEATAGCISIDTDGFIKKIANIHQTEWKYLGDKPAIVDFYADWCGPCKMIAPILEELAKEYDGKLYVYKVNIDNNKAIAEAFKISAIPTLLFIPMQGEPEKKVGGISKEEFEKIIKENLLK